MKTTITIEGTHCNACKMLIEDVCTDVLGIDSCEVNFETGETIVDHNESLDWDSFKEEIEELGSYKVKLPAN